MYEFSRNLASVVQAARIAHGLTQDELAEHIGVSGKSISNIERGIANPEFGTIYSLFRLLKIDANSVFYPLDTHHDSLEHQFHRLIATCSHEELEILLAVSDTLIEHLHKKDAVNAIDTE